MFIQKIDKSYNVGRHIQIAGNPSRYEILNYIGNIVVAYANNIRYSKKVHIIGQSAASLLSPL
jgi:hydroxypyruvate isomerase